MKNSIFFKIEYFYLTLFMLCFFKQSIQEFVEILDLKEGDVCRTNHDGQPNHICTHHDMCESSTNGIEMKQSYPNICSFNGSRPIICCPSTIENLPVLNPQKEKKTSMAEKKCQEYLGLVKRFSNGVAAGSILNQKNTTATIGYGQSIIENIFWACGGSLISKRWILTAAHCKQMGLRDMARWVRVGDFMLQNTDTYEIEQHIIHPDYKPPSMYNDIALFKVSTEVKFSSSVRPICLNSDALLNPREQIAIGRETELSADGGSTDSVLKINLLVVSGSQCNKTYSIDSRKQLKFGILEDRMICGSSLDGKTDTCGGDSGGSLLATDVKNPGTYVQFGITSFGKYCGDKNIPGVYTRVSYYISWIEKNVWP